MMKRSTILLALLVAALPLAGLAQVPTPGATPKDWQEYNDPAMHFRAPAGWVPIGQRQVNVNDLGEDPMTVAAWVLPKTNPLKRIVIQQEYFQGTLEGFLTNFEQAGRQQFSDALFKDRQATELKNGMPAYFVDMTWGSGFNVQKAFMLLWVDGQRGVAVVVTAAIGEMDMETARRLLSDTSAVQYPVGRE